MPHARWSVFSKDLVQGRTLGEILEPIQGLLPPRLLACEGLKDLLSWEGYFKINPKILVNDLRGIPAWSHCHSRARMATGPA
jgi:hypothetical protein